MAGRDNTVVYETILRPRRFVSVVAFVIEALSQPTRLGRSRRGRTRVSWALA